MLKDRTEQNRKYIYNVSIAAHCLNTYTVEYNVVKKTVIRKTRIKHKLKHVQRKLHINIK